MGESSGYETMAKNKVRDEMDVDVNEFIIIKKDNFDAVEVMELDAVEALMNQNIESNDQLNDNTDTEKNHLHYDDNIKLSEKIRVNFSNDTNTSEIMDNIKVKQEWSNNDYFMPSDENEMNESDEKMEDTDNYDGNSDEETIATFITSTGQQLALYAVEDSEEVFAVAVYNESGGPPTNFQFLMKADVERLIGEGAVRTVKKPQQMKKQTYQGELTISRDKEMYPKAVKRSSKSYDTIENTKQQIKRKGKHSDEYFMNSNDALLDNEFKRIELTVEETNADNDNDLTYHDLLDNSYFLLHSGAVKETNLKLTNDNNKVETQTDTKQNDVEITEQSTVQYILYDDDESDSELTFDEIKRSLQHFDKSKKIKSLKKSAVTEKTNTENINFNGVLNSPPSQGIVSPQTPVKITPEKPTHRILQASSVVKHKHTPNALLGRKSSNIESKQTVFIQGSTALICCPIPDIDGSLDVNCKESSDCNFKIKRPRKQQLTIVNRTDSEIIIQPASMVSEDEEEHKVPKKRGRRKKRCQNIKNIAKARNHLSRISSNHKSRIEIIDIDVDNEYVEDEDDDEDDDEGEQRRNNIQEIITIEDGKEKGSSDKENEVIMVGDSDDDVVDNDKGEKSNKIIELQKNIISPILKCDHCNRNFRQKRALDTHSRVCPKSPHTRRKLTVSSRSNSVKSNDTNRHMVKKQYICKICQEKFDVVVALARHVRSHYKKKETVASVTKAVQMKRKPEPLDTDNNAVSTSIITQQNKGKRQLIAEQKNKERLNSHRGWNSKKMSCIDCGRWFASAALLSAHGLQHATKKSEKRIKRCQICRKLFRSRLIYIRHMRMHSKAKQLQKRIKRTRQSTNTITTLRKRGRPRKL